MTPVANTGYASTPHIVRDADGFVHMVWTDAWRPGTIAFPRLCAAGCNRTDSRNRFDGILRADVREINGTFRTRDGEAMPPYPGQLPGARTDGLVTARWISPDIAGFSLRTAAETRV